MTARRLITNQFQFVVLLSGIRHVQQAVLYKNKLYRKRYVLLIMENGDNWKVPWYNYQETFYRARKISSWYAERQDGSIYLATVDLSSNFTK